MAIPLITPDALILNANVSHIHQISIDYQDEVCYLSLVEYILLHEAFLSFQQH